MLDPSEFNQDREAILNYLNKIHASIQQAQALQLSIKEVTEKGVIIELPYNHFIIGDPDTGAIHGGALTTLLDQTCGMSITRALFPNNILSPTLDLRIDHMTKAKPNQAVLAYAEVYRISHSVVFTKGVAYQDDINKPISHAIASFMKMELGSRDDLMAAAVKRDATKKDSEQ